MKLQSKEYATILNAHHFCACVEHLSYPRDRLTQVSLCTFVLYDEQMNIDIQSVRFEQLLFQL